VPEGALGKEFPKKLFFCRVPHSRALDKEFPKKLFSLPSVPGRALGKELKKYFLCRVSQVGHFAKQF
jgi:hypothetical protein